eukprot:3396199-Amphidinium_carterae.1
MNYESPNLRRTASLSLFLQSDRGHRGIGLWSKELQPEEHIVHIPCSVSMSLADVEGSSMGEALLQMVQEAPGSFSAMHVLTLGLAWQ